MGFASILVVPLSQAPGKVPALMLLLFVIGASQAAVETLVYVHVAQRLDELGRQTATHVGMCLFLLCQCGGGAVGSLAGGALQMQGWGVQAAVVAGMGASAAAYGVAVGVCGDRALRHSNSQA
jgi:hypothetical protein